MKPAAPAINPTAVSSAKNRISAATIMSQDSADLKAASHRNAVTRRDEGLVEIEPMGDFFQQSRERQQPLRLTAAAPSGRFGGDERCMHQCDREPKIVRRQRTRPHRLEFVGRLRCERVHDFGASQGNDAHAALVGDGAVFVSAIFLAVAIAVSGACA